MAPPPSTTNGRCGLDWIRAAWTRAFGRRSRSSFDPPSAISRDARGRRSLHQRVLEQAGCCATGARELLRRPGQGPSGRSGGDRRYHERHDPRSPRPLSKRRHLRMPELVTVGQWACDDADRAASSFQLRSDSCELLGRGRASAGAGCSTGRVARTCHAVAVRRKRHPPKQWSASRDWHRSSGARQPHGEWAVRS